MGVGQCVQPTLAHRRQAYPDDTAIATVGDAPYEAHPGRPVDELDRAVVAKHQMGRDIAHARGGTVAAHGQQELVLSGCNARRLGLLLAPVQEAPKTVSEVEEAFEVVVRKATHIETR